MSKSVIYLSCLFFFKAAVGAILLVTGWDSLAISENGLINITIIMALSFFPAAFARPLFQHLEKIPISHILTLSLAIAGLLIIFEHFLMEINLIATFIVHFILWIFIFVIEVGCEKWYVILSQHFELTEIRKLSGISTSLGQLGLVGGAILVMVFQKISPALPYWIIMLCFIISGACSASWTKSDDCVTPPIRHSNPTKDQNRKNWYILGFALIWPTLTIFNLSVPLFAKNTYDSLYVAGFLEILIAIATVVAGFSHPYITKSTVFETRTILVFSILCSATVLTYLYSNNIFLVATGVFILGLTF